MADEQFAHHAKCDGELFDFMCLGCEQARQMELMDEIKRLREALQQCLHVVQAEIDCCKNDTTAWYRLCFASLDKARSALEEKE